MIVVVGSITWKEAIELGQQDLKILLEYLFESSSKSKTLCKWCNNEAIIAYGGPGASSIIGRANSQPNEG